MCFAFIEAYAQHNIQVTKTQLELFKKGTTYVVMDNDPALGYNIAIKGAMDNCWKITPHKYISPDEFETMRKDKDKSFCLLTKSTLTKDKRNAEYLYLNFVMGDTATLISNMPELLTIPLAYSGVDENSYVYIMDIIVRFAQEHVKLMLNSSKITQFRNLKYYNDNSKKIKNKILLIEEKDLGEEVNTIEKIKMVYAYKAKIVDSDEIEKAITEKTPNTLVLHVIAPGEEDNAGRAYKIIYSIDDNLIYYYNYENISPSKPGKFMARDFKQISED
jgi:hypothetical protein